MTWHSRTLEYLWGWGRWKRATERNETHEAGKEHAHTPLEDTTWARPQIVNLIGKVNYDKKITDNILNTQIRCKM